MEGRHPSLPSQPLFWGSGLGLWSSQPPGSADGQDEARCREENVVSGWLCLWAVVESPAVLSHLLLGPETGTGYQNTLQMYKTHFPLGPQSTRSSALKIGRLT